MSQRPITCNVFLPNQKVTFPVKNLEGEGEETFRILGKALGSGYAGETYRAVHEASGEEVVLKILRPGKLRKLIVALLARLLATFDLAWAEVEVELAILNRELLARATRKRLGREYIVSSWRRSYGKLAEKGAYVLILPYKDCRTAYHGRLSGVGDSEIKERAGVARLLTNFFKKIGAIALAWQFNHSKHEPWGNWYIWLTVIIAIITVGASWFFHLPYDPKVNLAAVLVIMMTFAGASWLTSDNLKKGKEDGLWWGIDLEMGMPHIACCVPVALAVYLIFSLLHKFWGLTEDWAFLFALVLSPGYLFLFELPRLLENIRAGYPIPFGQLQIEDFAKEFGEEEEFQEDIALYRPRLKKFEAGRLNLWNRLFIRFIRLFGAKVEPLPFSWLELRLRTIERWELKGKVTSERAQRMRESFGSYLWFILTSFFGIIPWRFSLKREFRQRKIMYWKAGRIEKMLKTGQITRQRSRELVALGITWPQIISSFLFPRKLYRLFLERHYQKLLLRNFCKFCTSKSFIRRRAVARFHRYLRTQQDEGRISLCYYERVLALERDPDIHWWIILYFALMYPKAFTWPLRIFAASGLLLARIMLEILPGLPGWLVKIIEYDFVRYLPGWLAAIVLGMTLTALYEIIATLLLGAVFVLRVIPRSRIERFRVVRVIFFPVNVFLYVIFALLNGIPGFSIPGTPALITITRRDVTFAILILIRGQSASLRGVRFISLGMWGVGGLGEFYFCKFLVSSFAWGGRNLLSLKRRILPKRALTA